MKSVDVYSTEGRYRRGNTQMAQVTVLRGEDSSQRSDTRHVALLNGIWVGNNPDPLTLKVRAGAERTVASANKRLEFIAERIKELGILLEKNPTREELEHFAIVGLTNPRQIKLALQRAIKINQKKLADAKQVLENSTKYMDEMYEAYPVTVEFVGV